MSRTTSRRLANIYRLEDFEPASKRYLPKPVYEYVRNGAGKEISLRRNRLIFDQLLWQPHRLRNVSMPETRISLFGESYALPFGLAPTGGAAMVHYDADRVEAASARKHDVPYILSANALTPLEDVIKVNPKAWFAAYFPSDLDVIDAMLARLDNAGYRMLLLTIDVPVGALRIPETRAGYAMPIRPTMPAVRSALQRPRWSIGTFGRTLLAKRKPAIENIRADRPPNLFSHEIKSVTGAPDFTWEHVRHIRDRWPGTLILKGIMHPDDAVLAADHGANGIVLSNHGARQIDTTRAPIEILAETRRRVPQMTLIIDSGFRSGNDVLKARALGADLVLIGRPILQACALAGQRGVDHAIDLLAADVRRNLALLGAPTLGSLTPDLLSVP